MKKILIKNGHIIDPANKINEIADLLIEAGKIKKIEKNISETNAEVINAKNLIVTPGLIDLQVHFREPGREDRENIETGSKAALMGGVTSVVTMPNTSPVADNQTVINHIRKRSRELDLINIFPAGAITIGQKGEKIAEMWEMIQCGAVAMTEDGFDVQDEGVLLNAMKYARTHDILIMSHCECENLSQKCGMHEGWVSTQMGVPGSPGVSEDLAVLKNIYLARESGCRLHLLHNSTKGAVEAIREAKLSGLKNLTAEVSVQHFALTDEVALKYNANAKMYPPIRSAKHVDAVIEAIKDDTIDCFTTDHAPHTEPDKICAFEHAAFGSVGVETSFSVMNTYLVQKKHISIQKGIEKMTVAPAKIIRVEKGTLSIGADADVSIFDQNRKYVVEAKKGQSKGKNCVFDGIELQGKAIHTIVGGKIKVRDERLVV